MKEKLKVKVKSEKPQLKVQNCRGPLGRIYICGGFLSTFWSCVTAKYIGDGQIVAKNDKKWVKNVQKSEKKSKIPYLPR